MSGLGRRGFLRASSLASGGLVFALSLPFRSRAGRLCAAEGPRLLEPNVWLRIDGQGLVTVTVKNSEMGQGVRTTLPMLVAEELEADWASVRVENAVAHEKYGFMITGGSGSTITGWERLRKAGAAAREMLVAAAAQAWGVPARECRARKGRVLHEPSGRSRSFGELVAAAASLTPPRDPPLKDPKAFTLIGTRVGRIDAPDIVTGRARYGIDVRVPGMLHCVIVRPPRFGARVVRVEDVAARRLPGVRAVLSLEPGVAVVADSTWQALRARQALQVTWSQGDQADLTSEKIEELFRAAADQPPVIGRDTGDVEAAFRNATRQIQAEYALPYQAPAPMEPMNCTAHVTDAACEIWAPTQVQTAAMEVAKSVTGLPPARITLHTTLLGGGFGRRLEVDYVREALLVSKAIKRPVQVLWTREDDLRHGVYRPASLHRVRACFDERGDVVAFVHHLVAPCLTPDDRNAVKEGLDLSAVHSIESFAYGIPSVQVRYRMANTAVPPGNWRGVFGTQNVFVNECFLDEMAFAAGQDPLELRRRLLRDARPFTVPSLSLLTQNDERTDPRRLLAVLELAAQKAGWGQALPPGCGRGVACQGYLEYGTFVAMVAEVAVERGRGVTVRRIVCAIDCGQIVNPSMVEAQMEGSVAFALTATLRSAITIRGGAVEQSNFQDFPLLTISEMPPVEVHILPSTAPPGGVGEPGVPVTAPAVLNAVHAATGKRLRRLPVRKEDLA